MENDIARALAKLDLHDGDILFVDSNRIDARALVTQAGVMEKLQGYIPVISVQLGPGESMADLWKCVTRDDAEKILRQIASRTENQEATVDA